MLVLVLSPSSSVARNVTVVLPSGSDRLALVPVANTSPPTSHEVEAMLPSESDAEAVRATVSPDSPSLSDTLRLPPKIKTSGIILLRLSVIMTDVELISPFLFVALNSIILFPYSKEILSEKVPPVTSHSVLLSNSPFTDHSMRLIPKSEPIAVAKT